MWNPAQTHQTERVFGLLSPWDSCWADRNPRSLNQEWNCIIIDMSFSVSFTRSPTCLLHGTDKILVAISGYFHSWAVSRDITVTIYHHSHSFCFLSLQPQQENLQHCFRKVGHSPVCLLLCVIYREGHSLVLCVFMHHTACAARVCSVCWYKDTTNTQQDSWLLPYQSAARQVVLQQPVNY